MFIRQTKKQNSKDGKIFYQYALVQATRIEGKPRQRTILYLGSDKELHDKKNRAKVADVLKNKIMGMQPLFSDIPKPLHKLAMSYYEKYLLEYGESKDLPHSMPPDKAKADYESVDLNGVEVDQVRSFGPEHLCLQTLGKLDIAGFLQSLGMSRKDTDLALISIAARAIYATSEHKTAQILEMNSSLVECVKYDESISHKQLYRISDMLYERKDKLDELLYNRITDLFDLDDKLVIYDISNTYFESRKDDSQIATFGWSKEKRYDCPIVVFTGVINAEGFIRHSRIYEGNKPDRDTLMDMIADLEKHSPATKDKTIVIDAGIADDDNLAELNEKDYKYVCVSRTRLADYPAECLDTPVTQSTERGKSKVRLSVFNPKEYSDTWMMVHSEANPERARMGEIKEQSMQSKLRDRFEQDLATVEAALHVKRGTKRIKKVWERIGRYKERHRHVSGAYNISVSEKDGIATAIQWTIKENKKKDDKAKGIYFIRTNLTNPGENQLWDIYNTIREVEGTFRCLKSDLNIRPVHHQNDWRIEAHIYLTILAYQLVNAIRFMLKQANIKHDWQNIVRIMSTQTLQSIELPTDSKVVLLRKPAKPIQKVREIYDATLCNHTQKEVKKDVVYH